MAEKKTRKRTEEEQALWDSMESLKAEKVKSRVLVASALQELDALAATASDADIASVARAYLVAKDHVNTLTLSLSEKEASYKELRSAS